MVSKRSAPNHSFLFIFRAEKNRLLKKGRFFCFTHAPEGHTRKGVDEWPSVQGSA